MRDYIFNGRKGLYLLHQLQFMINPTMSPKVMYRILEKFFLKILKLKKYQLSQKDID